MNPKDKASRSKSPISLVPSSAIIHLSEAMKEGAEKYEAYNWRKDKVEAMCYLDAILRHTLALLDGEDIDPESKYNKHHMAGVLASAAVYIDAMENNTLIDNRPPKGNAGELLRKLSERNEYADLSPECRNISLEEYEKLTVPPKGCTILNNKLTLEERKVFDEKIARATKGKMSPLELQEFENELSKQIVIDDSKCISMDEHFKKVNDPNDNYGKRYIKK